MDIEGIIVGGSIAGLLILGIVWINVERYQARRDMTAEERRGEDEELQELIDEGW